MARQLIISQDDLQSAESFLAEFLTESVPEASFVEGSALRDLAVKAFSYIFAYLRAENALLDAKRSLKQVTDAINNGQSINNVDDLVDEALSNWFLTRNDGGLTRVTAVLHFTRKGAVSIQQGTQFWRTNTQAFYVDTSAFPYVIPESDMLPTFDVRGQLVDYVVNVPLRAAQVGEGYNFPSGSFVKVDAPGGLPYFSYAEQRSDAKGGYGVESNDQIISRAQTAISVRNLINYRSCDVVLREEFPGLDEVLTVGMGEPEMMRDLRPEIGPHLKLHIGGHYDTYVDQPLVQVEENLRVGGFYPRPDGIINLFRDPLLTYDTPASDFVTLGVQVGHVLYIISGITGTPRGYIITNVLPHELEVSENIPFTEASDELAVNTVVYSIGEYSPLFLDIIPAPQTATVSTSRPDVPVGTSRRVCMPGAVVLTAQPVQEFLSVEVKDPDAADAAIIDPSSGTIRFTDRCNKAPVAVTTPAASQYQFVTQNPYKSQSSKALNLVNVGYLGDEDHFDGKTLRVAYRSFLDFTSISDFVESQDQRILAGNHLIKARNPVWVYCTIPYRLKPTATSAFSDTAAAQMIADYINAFDPNDNLDMNDLATQLRNNYNEVGTVFPFDIFYDLYSPDGQLIQFKTADIVSIFSLSSNGVTLANSADIVVPPEMQAEGISVIDDATLTEYLNLRGISDRVIKYRCDASMVSFEVRG
jgi:hypothetical protein